jgi:DNA-binding PadR family transcriptional regulator
MEARREPAVREALLTLLQKEPSHGYELKLAIESMFGELWPAVNIGQVYSTLGRLERAGLVRSAEVAQDSRPDKRVYELTPLGRDALRQWVDDVMPAGRVRDAFFSKLVLAWKTRLADPVVLIDRQRRAYLLRLRELNEMAEAATGLVARLAVEAAVLHVQADLRLLEFCEQAVGTDDTRAGG